MGLTGNLVKPSERSKNNENDTDDEEEEEAEGKDLQLAPYDLVHYFPHLGLVSFC